MSFSAGGLSRLAAAAANGTFLNSPSNDSLLHGSLLPKIDYKTWPGWSPRLHMNADSYGPGWSSLEEVVRDASVDASDTTTSFADVFASWPDYPSPSEIQVWCKGFIPKNASNFTVVSAASGEIVPVVPLTGPGGLPIPGYLGICARIDGRDWHDSGHDDLHVLAEASPSRRPDDARFWGWLRWHKTAGATEAVEAGANCGFSENYCCKERNCWGGVGYGEKTCGPIHCDDKQMRAVRTRCWRHRLNDTNWSDEDGEDCSPSSSKEELLPLKMVENSLVGKILAAKTYIQGRGGDPCVQPLYAPAPPSSWDVGIAVFPTKRKVLVAGYVDDAPSFECYARAREESAQKGRQITLAKVPMKLDQNVAIELMGHSDVPVNAERGQLRVWELSELHTGGGGGDAVRGVENGQFEEEQELDQVYV